YFLTKIFHPNIATNGEICVNTLKRDWKPSLGLRHVLVVSSYNLVFSFLTEMLYTGIHALKPKPKFKSGAISESTAALNVDQTNASVCSVDPKTAVSGAIVQPTPLAPSLNTMKGGSAQEPSTPALNSMAEIGGVSSGSGAAAPPPTVATQQKEGGLAKAQTYKKKIDARKKSLKRL
ncbi:Ubiquitin-conjugating enzyme, active site-containing protein, partial [Cynara cardunculus var. scolymus]